MKVELYKAATAGVLSRRRMLQGATALAGLAAMPRVLGYGAAAAQDSVRAQILAIPGVGAGSPTDADWKKVG